MSETFNRPAPEPFLPDPGKPRVPWKDWIRLFNNYMTATNYAELASNRKKAILLHLIGLEGQTVYYSLRDDTQIANNTYEQVLQCLENHFADKVNVVSERYSFGCRIQKSGESIDEVVVALRRLAQKCDFGAFLNTSLRDQLIKGVREIRVRDRLLQDNPYLEECLKIAKRIEAGIATSVFTQKYKLH